MTILDYPNRRHDTLQVVKGFVNPFWFDDYGGASEVLAYLRGFAIDARWLENKGNQWYTAHNRHDCPETIENEYYAIEIYESAATLADVTLIGENLIGAGQSIGASYSGAVKFPTVAHIWSFSVATDSLLRPHELIAYNCGAYTDGTNKQIVFARNPFTSGKWLVQTNDLGQNYIRVYLHRANTTTTPSSIVGRIWANAVAGLASVNPGAAAATQAAWDCVVEGSTSLRVKQLIAACTGGVFATQTATVLAVSSSSTETGVIETDKEVLFVPPGDTPTVVVGQTVNAGDSLTDRITWHRVTTPGVPPVTLTSLTLPATMLGSGSGPVTFSNSSTPLVVQTGVSGYTKLTWSLTGDSGDVTAFFDKLHTQGVAAGATLANYLDTRDYDTTTQPTAADLPGTVVPLNLLFSGPLRHSLAVVEIRAADISTDFAGLTVMYRMLRNVVDPHQSLLILEV